MLLFLIAGMNARIVLALFLSGFCLSASAATVSGTVYDSRLEPVAQLVVQAFSLPSFSKVGQLTSQNGSYSFELEPGNYSIVARHYFNSSFSVETGENLSVSADTQLDIIFLGPVNFSVPSEALPEELEENPPLSDEDVSVATSPDRRDDSFLLVAGLAVFAVAAYALWMQFRKSKKSSAISESPPAGHRQEKIGKPAVPVVSSKQGLSRDEKQLLELIKRLGGRVAQKELRKNIDWSEAAVSMTLSELEDKGFVRKIKKGRGNIVRLA